MIRKLKVPAKPTKEETRKLINYLSMADWHFDVTIKKKCTEMSAHSVYWQKGEEFKWIKATVFGLEAIKVATKEPCIANIFIRYKHRVYQVECIVEAAEIIQLLKKEHEYEEYKSKLWNFNWKRKQKIMAAKRKATGRIKKLRIVTKKEAA